MTQQLFQIGEEASIQKFMSNIEDLRSQGTSVLDTMTIAETDMLLTLDRKLSSINAHRQRANRIQPNGVYVLFPTSDFLSIDQGYSTATVRIDSQTASLKEKQTQVMAVIKKTSFSSNMGFVQALDQTNSLWTVTTDGTSPTGTIDIELTQAVSLSLITIDIAASPSNPTIVASASADNVVYINATSIDLNGYRVNVWFTPQISVKYFRFQVTPTHSDDPNGFNFTFGMTSFDATGIQYMLRSDLITNTISFAPVSTQATLQADVDPNIQYFLSLDGASYVEIEPNTPIKLPGTIQRLIDSAVISAGTIPGASLQPTAYINTVMVLEDSTGTYLNVVPNLSPTDSDTYLLGKYVGLEKQIDGSWTLNLISKNSTDFSGTYTVSYVYGPSSITAQLKVRISTMDNTVSPTFRGCTLEEM